MQKLANLFKIRYNKLINPSNFVNKLPSAKGLVVTKSLIPAQRREWIQEYLSFHKIVSSADLCEMLAVSEATVRRDLEYLENEGVLERTHGGAILSQRIQLEPAYNQRALQNPEEKRQIGAAAAGMVRNGDIIFINSGTTSSQLIHHIRGAAGITVITNNLSAALENNHQEIELLLLGGTFQPQSNSVAGRFAIENLGRVYADKVFIGVDGISPKYGCTVPSNAEAEVIRVMIERTRGPIVVVCDHTKWGVVSNFQVASMDQVDMLVTDNGLGEVAREEMAERGVKVLIANS